METIKKIKTEDFLYKPGDWICTNKGIGVLVKFHPKYWAYYNKKIPIDYDDYDLDCMLASFKLFCDYDGNPIKRNRFSYGLVTPECSINNPSLEDQKIILENAIAKYPKEYKSFQRFLKDQKNEPGGRDTICYEMDLNTDLDVMIQSLTPILENTPRKFTLNQLIEFISERGVTLNKANFYDWGDKWDVPNITFFLYFTIGDFEDNDTLYYRVRIEKRNGLFKGLR